MIIVRFTSGLGNQMFQYSLYSYLREKYNGVSVKADVTWFKRFSEHQGYEVKRIFGRADNPYFQLEQATAADIVRCSGRIPNTVKGSLGEVWQFILRVPHRILKMTHKYQIENGQINQTGFEDNAEIYRQIESIDPEKDYYITGFFIEEIYYRNRLKDLQRAFSFDDKYSEQNKNYIQQITTVNSVSIHVRRGDYLSKQYSSSFLSLPMDYYRKGVEIARQKLEKPRFFIFSDDKEYINESFGWLEDKVIVEGNTGADSYRDMQLMSLCKMNIIANSTFSVWAGLLNTNAGRTVVYPAAYMAEKDSEIKTIDGFIRI